MEKILVILFLICSPSMWAQTTFLNESNEDISLTYESKTLYAKANMAILWPDAPKGKFIAYVYQKDNEKDVDLIKKIGFVQFENKESFITFSSQSEVILFYLHNTQECRIMVEYGKNAVYIPAGDKSLLPDYYVSPSFISTILWTKYCGDEFDDEIQSARLEFTLTEKGLEAEL